MSALQKMKPWQIAVSYSIAGFVWGIVAALVFVTANGWHP